MVPFQTNRKTIIILLTMVLVLANAWLIKENYKQTPSIAGQSVAEIVPIPTTIDENFITQVNECFLPIATIYGYTLRITSDFRSVAEQEELFAQGRDVEGHIVTQALPGKSIHNYGFAVDVVDRWRGFDINWQRLGKIGTYCSLEQGDEDYDEKAHFQNRNGLTTQQFELGFRPPMLTLPCPIMHERAVTEEPLTMADLNDCGAPKF